jgi:CheY-like chemotaxis protein
MEKFLAEDTLQHGDLSRNGRLRYVQLLGRLAQVAFLGDHPEIPEVVIVQEFHRPQRIYFKLTTQSISGNWLRAGKWSILRSMKTVMPKTIAPARAARMPLVLKSFTSLAFDGITVTAKHQLPATAERTRVRSILLVSEDVALGDALGLVAARNALSLVRTPSLREAIDEGNRAQPAAIFLDLDLSSDAGWHVAEWFHGQEPRVPILMLTERADHHELGAAVRSGMVFDKSNGSARLLHALESMLAESGPQGRGRLALQRSWLRRAKPYRWGTAGAPAYRQWGINE